jgi:hypothetical protein
LKRSSNAVGDEDSLYQEGNTLGAQAKENSDDEWGHEHLDSDDEEEIGEELGSDEEIPDMDEDPEEKTGVHQEYVNGDLVETKTGEELDEEQTLAREDQIVKEVDQSGYLNRKAAAVKLDNSCNRMVS